MRPRSEPVEKVFFETHYARADNGARPVPARLDAFVEDLLELLEPLEGQCVLDLGCGEGELSVALARRGARVVSVDLARAGLALARRRAGASEATLTAVCASVHRLPFPDASFDRVAGSRVLHHLELAPAAEEVRRVLAPGGRAAFSENFYTNPILFLCREFLAGRFGIPRFGTPTERPLSGWSLGVLSRHFSVVRLSYPSFLFFHLLDRQIFGCRHRGLNRLMIELDRLVHSRLPFLRPFSYRANIVLDP
ncbi:MAG: class I SAM-dependent methyltransferase [Planctomycetes bacterium]|nr:class I SAM-dependent methyltransferase [Planctomycetota bacterium]